MSVWKSLKTAFKHSWERVSWICKTFQTTWNERDGFKKIRLKNIFRLSHLFWLINLLVYLIFRLPEIERKKCFLLALQIWTSHRIACKYRPALQWPITLSMFLHVHKVHSTPKSAPLRETHSTQLLTKHLSNSANSPPPLPPYTL